MQNNEFQNEADGSLSAREAELAGAFREDALDLSDAEQSVGDEAMSPADTLAVLEQLRAAGV